MERIATNGNQVPGVEDSDVRLAREHAVKDITKLYLMSYYWTILAMTTVGNLPHPNTKFQYVYVIFQLLGKALKLQIITTISRFSSLLPSGEIIIKSATGLKLSGLKPSSISSLVV